MKPLVVAFPEKSECGSVLAKSLDAELAQVTVRQFPDGESYLRFLTPVDGRDVVIASSLHRPDDKTLQTLLVADTARDLGARQVGLVSPYLPYMRQDARFEPGEGITSRYFARLLSSHFDWMATVDPHLHRYETLDEIYTMKTRVVRSASLVAQWIATHVEDPLLIGPDSESNQWVEAVARTMDVPFVILDKVRVGDRDVEVSGDGLQGLRSHTPVLIDDIISTARTMITAIEHLAAADLPAPVCVGVHGIFADDACDELIRAGAGRVVTCNTIEHSTNAIDVFPALAQAAASLLHGDRGGV